MAKQRLEGIFSKSLSKSTKNLWFLKLQVMKLAHTTMPADFIVLTNTNRYLVECKERKTNDKGYAAFAFSDLTQESDLINFERHSGINNSYVLLLFWSGTLKNSDIYMVPIKSYMSFKANINKQSFNTKDAQQWFKTYKVSVKKGSILDIDDVFR